ncbi:MAG: TIM barrel protein [Pirellulaceae bacterium]
MKLSLSVRIAEAACKTKLNVPFRELVHLARELGYHAICMRASAGGVGTPVGDLESMRRDVEDAGLVVSMVTADSDVPLNNDDGPNCLRQIGASLDVAEALGCNLIRVCLKKPSDTDDARRAAEQAAERGIRLAHQCHTTTLFEQIDRSLHWLEQIGCDNFGLIYEPANLMLCNESYDVKGLEQLKPWIMNVYVQNHRLADDGPVTLETWCVGVRRFHHIPIWEKGGVDFDSVIHGLNVIGYEGYFTVHQAYAEIMGPREAAVESSRYLTSFGCFD